MKWFYKLERKLGRFAIKNLMLYLIILYTVGTLLFLSGNQLVYYEYLCMDPGAIMHGEVWRLVTFLMMPPGGSNPFFMILSLYIYWNLGSIIERVWGAFRFNVYIFSGIIGTIIASFLVYFVLGGMYSLTVMFVGTTYLNFSLFLAYAFTFPDAQFLLFFIVPIKAKYLGAIEALVYVVLFITGSVADKIMIGVSLLNAIVFFLVTKDLSRLSPSNVIRRAEFKKKASQASLRGYRHKCAVCGRTDEDDETLQFRFCSRCEGNYEYCEEHLYTHTHVTKEDAERLKVKA